MRKKIEWNNPPLLFRTAFFGFVFGISSWIIIGRAIPPEGYVFERLPAVAGIYGCCGSTPRTSYSWVGEVSAICNNYSYFPWNARHWLACEFKEQLNGRVVTLERALIPGWMGKKAIAIKISASGEIFYELTDQQIRENWISQNRGSVLFNTIFLMIFFHFSQVVYLNRNSSKYQD